MKLIIVFVLSALIFIINDPLSKIGGIDVLNFTYLGMENSLFFALLAFIAFILLLFNCILTGFRVFLK